MRLFCRAHLLLNAACLMGLFLLLASPAAFSQDYPFAGELIEKKNYAGESLGEFICFKDELLSSEEIKVRTMRYASDTTVLNNNGNLIQVERLMDLYYPNDSLRFEFNGDSIERFPLMVLLHAGPGNKNTAVNNAMFWASRGFTVLVPTYRSNRFGFNWCYTLEASIYQSVQDVRAAVRFFTRAFDLSLAMSNEQLVEEFGPLAGPNFLELADVFRVSRVDSQNLFMTGHSYGGSTSFHLLSRLMQDDFPDYLLDSEPFVMTGPGGTANVSGNGLLDDVGNFLSLGHSFPVERIKGALCRAAAGTDLDVLFSAEESRSIPLCFIHNTCDALTPYDVRDIEGPNAICNPLIMWPNGDTDSSITAFGAYRITKVMEEKEMYYELNSFCGGGHESNVCSKELIDEQTTDFFVRVMQGETSNHEDSKNFVFHYDDLNYSAQCCQIGDDYAYLDICDCESPPANAIVQFLPEVFAPASCLPTLPCDLENYCDLEADTTLITSLVDGRYFRDMRLHVRNGYREVRIYDRPSSLVHIQVTDHMGRVYHRASGITNAAGEAIIQLPEILPKMRLLILSSDGQRSLKFLLE